MGKRILRFLTILTGIYLVILMAMFFAQEQLIFFPEKLPDTYKFNYPWETEERFFPTEENISIHALHFKADSAKGLIFYLHGNAGSLSTWGGVAGDFLPLGYDVLVIDYRGYGKSSGKISSEDMLHHDADFIYGQLASEYGEENIIIYGRSIGTGIASKLAAARQPKLLILETPHYNFKDLVNKIYPFVPASLLLKYHFRNDTYIQQVTCPVHLIHGTADQVIPYNSSVRLAALEGGIRLHTIDGGGHNDLSEFPEFQKILASVLQ